MADVILPLNACQNSGHIVGRAPTLLENVQAELAGSVDVRVEHLANKFDARRLVGVLFFKVHHEAERPVFERRLRWPDDDRVPLRTS